MSEEHQDQASLLHDLRASLFQILAIYDIAENRKQPLSPEDTGRVRANALFMKQLLDQADNSKPAAPTARTIMDSLLALFAEPECLTVSLPDDCADTPLVGGPQDWSRILLNLSINAHREIKSQLDGTPVIGLNFSFNEARDALVIAFSDNGPGISLVDHQHVFEPGYTTHQSTGLGLASSRKTARDLGGDLTLDPTFADGAKFLLSIPALVAESSAEKGFSNPTNALRILAIDDDVEMLNTYERIVLLDGHSLTPAVSAAEAFAELEKSEFDVVLLDVRLSEMSGMTFYRLLSDQNPTVAARVVFATGDQQSMETVEFLQKTGRPFLIKPFQIDDLRRALTAGSSGL